MYELHASAIAQPELRSKVATWLAGLTVPITFELVADAEGVRIRAAGGGFGDGVGGFASLTGHALRWVPAGDAGLPPPDHAWVLEAQSDLPTLHHAGDDPFLMWADRLRSAAEALGTGGEVALRLAVVGDDPELQRKLRALSAYNYGGHMDEEEPHLWVLQLKLWHALLGIGGATTAFSGGALAAGWIPTPVGIVTTAAGLTLFFVGMVGWHRWLRIRSIPRELLERYAAGPLLRVCIAITTRGGSGDAGTIVEQFFSQGLPLSGPIRPAEITPPVLDAAHVLDGYALPFPGSDLAALLTPAEGGDPSSVLHPEVRMDVPSPPPSPALRAAQFRVGRAVAGGAPVGIDPDGHGLVVGGSRSGKSSMAYVLLEQLLEEPRNGDHPGIFLVDPHESLANAFLAAVDRLPAEARAEAVERLLVVTPDQPEVVPLNLLTVPDFAWAGNALIQVGNRIWDDYWGPRMQSALLALFRLAQAWNTRVTPQERLSLFHLVFAAFQPEWRRHAMLYLPPEARMGSLALDTLLGQFSGINSTWQQGWTTEVVSPVISKVMALELAPWLFAAMHQPRFVDLERAVRDRRWIVLRIPAGKLGGEGSRLLAAVVYNIWEAAFRHAATAEEPVPYYVIVDEAQQIASGMRLETLLAEGAKFGARLFVLTQGLTMLRAVEEFEAVVQSLLANTSTQVFFSPDPEDAELIRDVLSSRLRYGEMTLDLPSLTYWLRARIAGRWQPPALVESEPLPFVASGDVAGLVREVIEAHPDDYVRPEMGLEASLRALQAMVPGRHRHLLRRLADAPFDRSDDADGADVSDGVPESFAASPSSEEARERDDGPTASGHTDRTSDRRKTDEEERWERIGFLE